VTTQLSVGEPRPVHIAVTIVVCTRNRGHKLGVCLASIALAIQNGKDLIETIIVDNGSTDDTRLIAQKWAASFPAPVQVLSENRPGLAIARNTAIRHARGSLIVFTDDDCELSSDYFNKLSSNYSRDDVPIIRGGAVERGNLEDIEFTTKRDPNPSRLLDITNVGGFVLGCNMIVPREALVRLGPFDERFGAGAIFRSGEDTDLICRAYLAGVPVEYVPDMVVFHYHGRRASTDVRKLYFGYCIGNGAIYAKYGFASMRLLRHFYWDSRNAVLELFGGSQFQPDLGLTYRRTVLGNIWGMGLYVLERFRLFVKFTKQDTEAVH
jgi:GT2 family glycosyltransferase